MFDASEETLDAHHVRPLLNDLAEVLAAVPDRLLNTALVFRSPSLLLRRQPLLPGNLGPPIGFFELGDKVDGGILNHLDDGSYGGAKRSLLGFLPLGRPADAAVG